MVFKWVYMDSELAAHTRGPWDLLWILRGSQLLSYAV